MGKEKELSSTKNLLEIIRGEKEITPKAGATGTGIPSKELAASVAPVGFDARKTTVGISFDDAGIYLFAIEKTGNKKRIIDFEYIEQTLPDEPDIHVVKDVFFRKGVLERFQLKKTKNWFLINSDTVDFWTISIPKTIEGKDISNAIYWAAKGKKKFDDNLVVFDYFIIDEITEKGVDKIRAGVYTVPKKEITKIRALFNGLGVDLQGITTFSLSCSSLLEQSSQPSDNATLAVIVVNSEWSRIDLFHDNHLAFTRQIKTGMESFAVSIQDRSQQNFTPDVDLPIEFVDVDNFVSPEPMGFEQALAILDAQGREDGAGKKQNPALEKMSDEKFMELIEPAAQRLVRQLERTFDHFRMTMNVPALQKILFVGQFGRFHPVVKYIGAQLDVATDIVDPFVMEGLSPALPVPSFFSDKFPYTPSCSAALADFASTPNFLHTFQDRLHEKQVTMIHRILAMIFAGGVLCLVGFYLWNQQGLERKTKRHEMITKELAQYSGDISGANTTKLLGQLKKKIVYLRAYEKRFKPVAIFSEIAHLTPPSIQLNSLLSNEGADSTSNTLIIDGYVVGESIMLDSYLSNYIVMIENSLVFSDVKIQKTTAVENSAGEKVHFVLSVNIS